MKIHFNHDNNGIMTALSNHMREQIDNTHVNVLGKCHFANANESLTKFNYDDDQIYQGYESLD